MPEPSQLVLLEQLQSTKQGTKVRFLGCVHAYDGQGAQLTLKTSHPASSPDVPGAIVDVQNVLEDVNHELLEVGAWLNVIGYVGKMLVCDQVASNHSRTDSTSSKVRTLPSKNATRQSTRMAVSVAAILVWSAGAIKLGSYQSAVREYQKPLVAE